MAEIKVSRQVKRRITFRALNRKMRATFPKMLRHERRKNALVLLMRSRWAEREAFLNR